MKYLLCVLSICLLAASAASAAPENFPRPGALEHDIEFWKRIYSEVGTDGGLMHDSRDLSVVYEVVKIPTGLSNRSRERHTDKRRKHYRAILLTLAKGKRSAFLERKNAYSDSSRVVSRTKVSVSRPDV